MRRFEILFEDEHFVAINKPAGFSVHTPEQGNSYFVPRNRIILGLLRDQLGGVYLYPTHRLDHATTGVLVYAKTKLAASAGSEILKVKTYRALVRGFIEGEGVLDRPLKDEGKEFEASTRYRALDRFEFEVPVGRYPTARYSIVECQPLTGRRHQIRKHMKHFGHPIVGDTTHGDGDHNRFFKEALGLARLFLHAQRMILAHPITGAQIEITAPKPKIWRSFENVVRLAREGKCQTYSPAWPMVLRIREPGLIGLAADLL